jgi:hypothetical protein
MVMPFQFEEWGKLSTKSGWHLILMWPFGETNAAHARRRLW